ncbi:flagellar hook-associated protein FlgK [Herbaspirillum rhizosphaerae]|uniref:Flagellar hook-associated protein 1 n=1 Tax=Herbaspirillum rhizosphaerae TaxID=346179 RepID=A0ABW8Z3G1_9BURK
MATSIFSIGQSALAAAQAAQATTSHNISNATTPGYNRQVVVQSTAGGINYGYGFVGQGTQVAEIKRVYNDFLNKQVMASQTTASSLDSYYSQISQLDNLVADTSAGLSPALQDFFKATQNLASTPNNDAARQAALSAGQTLAARFQSLNDQMAQSRTSVNSQITSSVDSINSYATQIQALNMAILKASGASGVAPNDLLDQRDQAVADLNKIVKVTTLPQDNGSLSVFIGNGQPLVLGDQVSTLVATPAANDPTRLQLSFKSNGNTILIPDSAFSGGSLGGVLSYRTETLDVAQNTLGRVAIAMASAINTQQKLGQDQNGVMGTNFFNVGTPVVNSTTGNSATAALTATIVDASKLTTSDYSLGYNGTNYTITRLSDNNVTTITPPGTTFPVIVDGVQYAAPTMVAGDSFLIKPTVAGAGTISVALTSTQSIATAAPIVTSVTRQTQLTAQSSLGATNTGSGAVSAIAVNQNSATPGTTQTYTFNGGNLSLTPAAASSVTSGGVTVNYASGVPIPYTAGATISSGGVSFVLSGTPANGDSFVLTSPNVSTATISAGKVELDLPGPPATSSFTQLPAGSALNYTYDGQNKALVRSATAPATLSAVVVTHADGTTTPYGAGVTSIPFAAGDKIATGGFSFQITGTPSDGDVFAVKPNTNGVNDNRNALALNALQTANTIGNTSIQGSYSQMVSFIGNKTNEIDVTNNAEKARLTAIQTEQQSESGVNQDEELANMIKNQTAYQAAAKIIQAASDMLNVLFTLGG